MIDSLNIFNIAFAMIIIVLLILPFINSKKDKIFPFYLSCLLYIVFGLLFAAFWVGKTSPKIEDRYFYQCTVPLLLCLSYSLTQSKKFFFLKIMFLLILLLFSFQKDMQIISQNIGINDKEVNYLGAKKIGEIISNDVKKFKIDKKFNLVNLIDGNTRGTYYRYFFFLNQVSILPVEQYPQSKYIYVLSRYDEKVTRNFDVWEINSSGPKKLLATYNAPFKIKIYKYDNINIKN